MCNLKKDDIKILSHLSFLLQIDLKKNNIPKKYLSTGNMGDQRIVLLVIEIFSENKDKKFMSLYEIAKYMEEKIGKDAISKRFKNLACFNSAVRNTLTMYDSFKIVGKNERGRSLWFYDKDEKLARKKYEKKRKTNPVETQVLPEPPRFPEELFLQSPVGQMNSFENPPEFFLWYTKDNIPFGK